MDFRVLKRVLSALVLFLVRYRVEVAALPGLLGCLVL